MNDDAAFSRNFLIGQFRGGVRPKSHPITRVNHFGGLFEISLPLFSFFFFFIIDERDFPPCRSGNSLHDSAGWCVEYRARN